MVLLASDYDKSRFLKADDIKGERKFRVKAVTEEEIGTGANKDKKLVVWFTNDDRGLVLNKTNNRILRGEFGDDTAGWISSIIILLTMMKPMQGRMVPGLSVRIPPPKQAGVGTAKTMTAGREYDGNGLGVPSATAKSKPVKKPSVQDDELDEIIDKQLLAKSSGDDELNDDLDNF